MAPDIENDDIDGIDTKEPAFGLPAKWISEDHKDEAELSGYTVVDPPSVVSTHITEVIKKHRSEEHTSELQSRGHLVCRLLLEKKKLCDVQRIEFVHVC